MRIIELTEAEYHRATDGMLGYCLGCGDEADGVEQDTERRKCSGCGTPKVYGAEQLLALGQLEITPD